MSANTQQLNRRKFTLGTAWGGLGLLGLNTLGGCGGGGDNDAGTNVFLEQSNGVNEDRASQKLNEYFNVLFNQGVLYKENATEAFMLDGNVVKSEGQSYAMMICVMMNKRAQFEKIWAWTRNHMRHSSDNYRGRLAWLCRPTFNSGLQALEWQSAPDGEIWTAAALHLAAARGWGWNGVANYLRDDADYLCDTMTNPTPIHNTNARGGNISFGHTLLPFFNRQQNNLVNFVPESWSNYTDPSYAAPALFHYLATKHRGGNTYWNTIANAHRQLMLNSTAYNNQNLAPDFSEWNGRPYGSCVHSSDSWRITMNQTLDYLWAGRTEHITRVKNTLNYMRDSGLNAQTPAGSATRYMNAYSSVYYPSAWTDDPRQPYNDGAQIALYATGFKGGAAAEADAFRLKLLNSPVSTSYYAGLTSMLSLLILAGKFSYNPV